MKNNLFLMSILAVFIFVSCESQIEKGEFKEAIVELGMPNLRSLNPSNFENNWEEQKKIKITMLADSVDLPWVTYCPTSIPLEVRTDIKKADGWIFLSTPSSQYGTDYMIFYNRFSGLLKIFYYNSGSILTNNTVWEFFDEMSCGYFNQGLTFTAPMSTPLTGIIQRIGVNCLSNNSTLGVDQGWNCFQVPITYTGKNGHINVYSNMLNISELKLTGNYTETTTGTIIEDHYSTKENLIQQQAKSVVKVTGEAAGQWVKKEAEKAINKKEGIFKNIGTTAGNILTNIAQNGIAGLVSSGLNALFGSFLGTSSVNTPTVQTVELTTNGQIALSGTMTANVTGGILPLTYIERTNGFGVWNLRTKPKATAIIHHHTWGLGYNNPYGKRYYQEYYDIVYSPSYELVINPEIMNDITYTVKHQFVEFAPPGGINYAQQYTPSLYIYRNNAMGKRMELSLTPNISSFLISPNLWICAAVHSSNHLISPISPDYNTSYIKYTGTVTSYNQWINSCSGETLDYFPKEVFPFGAIVPGNYGLNVTVTIKIKATGQEIISSRTFEIEYDLKSK